MVDKHEENIKDIYEKLKLVGSGSGGSFDLSILDGYAKKDKLHEVEVQADLMSKLLVKHEKSLYQNSIFENWKTDDALRLKINDAIAKDRTTSAHSNGNRLSTKDDDRDVHGELDKIMDELEMLGTSDNCLTNRVINLEK
jgi:hypothetical protein